MEYSLRVESTAVEKWFLWSDCLTWISFILYYDPFESILWTLVGVLIPRLETPKAFHSEWHSVFWIWQCLMFWLRPVTSLDVKWLSENSITVPFCHCSVATCRKHSHKANCWAYVASSMEWRHFQGTHSLLTLEKNLYFELQWDIKAEKNATLCTS